MEVDLQGLSEGFLVLGLFTPLSLLRTGCYHYLHLAEEKMEEQRGGSPGIFQGWSWIQSYS